MFGNMLPGANRLQEPGLPQLVLISWINVIVKKKIVSNPAPIQHSLCFHFSGVRGGYLADLGRCGVYVGRFGIFFYEFPIGVTPIWAHVVLYQNPFHK